MISRQNIWVGVLLAAGPAIVAGCSSSRTDAGTAGGAGSGGAPATGGSVGVSGSSSGAPSGTAGTAPTGGAPAGDAGGAQAGGAGGMVIGSGGAAKGGMGGGGTTAMGGAGGALTQNGGAGGTASGTCQKGQVKAAEVVIMGESFYAIAPQYNEKRIEDDARKAGVLGANETYRNVAVSGQNMNYIATTEWTAATQG
ncbi:MAG TPA: hypothetical protein VIK01_17345, partial [Polyangiaceae bacterium]